MFQMSGRWYVSMSVEEIELKFKEIEKSYEKIEEVDNEFNEFIASLKELVY